MLALISRVIFGGRGEPGGYLSRMGRIAGKIRPIQTRLSLTINPSLFERELGSNMWVRLRREP